MTKAILIAILIGFNLLIGMAYFILNKKLDKIIRANNREQKENGKKH